MTVACPLHHFPLLLKLEVTYAEMARAGHMHLIVARYLHRFGHKYIYRPCRVFEILKAGAPEDAEWSYGVSCGPFRLLENPKVGCPENAKLCHGAVCGP